MCGRGNVLCASVLSIQVHQKEHCSKSYTEGNKGLSAHLVSLECNDIHHRAKLREQRVQGTPQVCKRRTCNLSNFGNPSRPQWRTKLGEGLVQVEHIERVVGCGVGHAGCAGLCDEQAGRRTRQSNAQRTRRLEKKGRALCEFVLQ